MSFFLGSKKLEEVQSPVNGKIEVIRGIAFGTYIQVENLTQSGGVVYEVWETVLKKVRKIKSHADSCLILGLGGGSVAKLTEKYWPEAAITGVDIDPLMVEMGKKYLGFDEKRTEVVIGDAEEYLTKVSGRKQKFDLIFVDMYVGTQVPRQFESLEFIKLLKKVLKSDGVAVFNRLYYGEKRKEAVQFSQKLSKVFKEVLPIYPEANVMYVSFDKQSSE